MKRSTIFALGWLCGLMAEVTLIVVGYKVYEHHKQAVEDHTWQEWSAHHG